MNIEALMETPFGSNLSVEEANGLMEISKVRELKAGQFLFHAGDQSHAMYIVLNGSLEVLLGSNNANADAIATISSGQICGELEAMTASMRMASLRSKYDSEVLEIPTKSFEGMLASNHSVANKLIHSIAKTLARRLATTNQHLLTKLQSAASAPVNEQASQSDSAPVANPESSSGNNMLELSDDDFEVLDKLWS